MAEVELLQAARLKPGSAEIEYFLARTYYMRGVYPLAKSEFETSIRLNPSYVNAYSNLGITMEALGDNEAALKNYKMAIQLQDRQKQISNGPSFTSAPSTIIRKTLTERWSMRARLWQSIPRRMQLIWRRQKHTGQRENGRRPWTLSEAPLPSTHKSRITTMCWG